MTADRILFRLAAAAAAIGAILRLITSIPAPAIDAQTGERLYLIVDFFLLLGLIGLFAQEDRLRTPLGAVGFIVAVAGFLLVRTGPRIGAFATYEMAASVLSLGLAVMGTAMIACGGWLRAAGAAWIASLLVGLAGAVLHLSFGFLVASWLFCLGFGFAAWVLFRPLSERSNAQT